MTKLLNNLIKNKKQSPRTWFFVGASTQFVYVWYGETIIDIYEPAWWHTSETDELIPYYGAPVDRISFYIDGTPDINRVERSIERQEKKFTDSLTTHIYKEV